VVICDSAAAWRSPLRRAFATAAHLVVLDQRAPAAAEEAQSVFDAHIGTAALVERLNGIVGVLENASVESKRVGYQQPNVAIEYHSEGRRRGHGRTRHGTSQGVGGRLEP
jgi:hypothetical protein